MKTKVCIFDLDGVIVDTAKYHFLAWKRLADELGVVFTLKDNERLKGVSRMESLQIILNLGKLSFSEDKKKELATKKNEWYREYLLKMKEDEILPGVKEYLTLLKENNIKRVLASASRNAPTVLKILSLESYFDYIVDIESVENPKPFPDLFLKGAELAGAEPDQCVVFEDAEAGIEAAHRGGIYAIGIGEQKNLKEADIVISGINEANLQILP